MRPADPAASAAAAVVDQVPCTAAERFAVQAAASQDGGPVVASTADAADSDEHLCRSSAVAARSSEAAAAVGCSHRGTDIRSTPAATDGAVGKGAAAACACDAGAAPDRAALAAAAAAAAGAGGPAAEGRPVAAAAERERAGGEECGNSCRPWEEVCNAYRAAGQSHVLHFYSQLSPAEQQQLQQQLRAFDPLKLTALLHQALQASPTAICPPAPSPASASTPDPVTASSASTASSSAFPAAADSATAFSPAACSSVAAASASSAAVVTRAALHLADDSSAAAPPAAAIVSPPPAAAVPSAAAFLTCQAPVVASLSAPAECQSLRQDAVENNAPPQAQQRGQGLDERKVMDLSKQQLPTEPQSLQQQQWQEGKGAAEGSGAAAYLTRTAIDPPEEIPWPSSGSSTHYRSGSSKASSSGGSVRRVSSSASKSDSSSKRRGRKRSSTSCFGQRERRHSRAFSPRAAAAGFAIRMACASAAAKSRNETEEEVTEELHAEVDEVYRHLKASVCPLVRLDAVPEAPKKRWRRIGLDHIRDGRVALVLLAGGDGSRLGFPLPKGCLPAAPLSKKSLFQLFVERLRRVVSLSQQMPASERHTVKEEPAAAAATAPAADCGTAVPRAEGGWRFSEDEEGQAEAGPAKGPSAATRGQTAAPQDIPGAARCTPAVGDALAAAVWGNDSPAAQQQRGSLRQEGGAPAAAVAAAVAAADDAEAAADNGEAAGGNGEAAAAGEEEEEAAGEEVSAAGVAAAPAGVAAATASAASENGRARSRWPLLLVMTSAGTRAATENYFRLHRYFGYPATAVHFFQQPSLPVFSLSGKLLLQAPGRLYTAPNGNGALFAALADPAQGRGGASVLQLLQQENVVGVQVCSVDNLLAKAADPLFLGICIDAAVPVGNKVIRRLPSENIGVMCVKRRPAAAAPLISRAAVAFGSSGALPAVSPSGTPAFSTAAAAPCAVKTSCAASDAVCTTSTAAPPSATVEQLCPAGRAPPFRAAGAARPDETAFPAAAREQQHLRVVPAVLEYSELPETIRGARRRHAKHQQHLQQQQQLQRGKQQQQKEHAQRQQLQRHHSQEQEGLQQPETRTKGWELQAEEEAERCHLQRVKSAFRSYESAESGKDGAGEQQLNTKEELLFAWGNICMHYFSLSFLLEIIRNNCAALNFLPYHLARKKVTACEVAAPPATAAARTAAEGPLGQQHGAGSPGAKTSRVSGECSNSSTRSNSQRCSTSIWSTSDTSSVSKGTSSDSCEQSGSSNNGSNRSGDTVTDWIGSSSSSRKTRTEGDSSCANDSDGCNSEGEKAAPLSSADSSSGRASKGNAAGAAAAALEAPGAATAALVSAAAEATQIGGTPLHRPPHCLQKERETAAAAVVLQPQEAYKLELFIFDVFAYAEQVLCVEVPRASEFAPIKTTASPLMCRGEVVAAAVPVSAAAASAALPVPAGGSACTSAASAGSSALPSPSSVAYTDSVIPAAATESPASATVPAAAHAAAFAPAPVDSLEKAQHMLSRLHRTWLRNAGVSLFSSSSLSILRLEGEHQQRQQRRERLLPRPGGQPNLGRRQQQRCTSQVDGHIVEEQRSQQRQQQHGEEQQQEDGQQHVCQQQQQVLDQKHQQRGSEAKKPPQQREKKQRISQTQELLMSYTDGEMTTNWACEISPLVSYDGEGLQHLVEIGCLPRKLRVPLLLEL